MTFRYTTLYVSDLKKTLSFYDAAFGLRAAFVHDGGQYAELATGATKLAFAEHGLASGIVGAPYARGSLAAPPPPFEIGLGVDDLPGAFQRAVAAGAIVVRRPERMPWGQAIAYVRDPDGALVVLVEGD
jgi:lactoylglutathione lyase